MSHPDPPGHGRADDTVDTVDPFDAVDADAESEVEWLARQRASARAELSRTAVAAARKRTRRDWRVWGSIGAVLVVLLAAFVFSVWRTSEIRNVSVRTATVSPSALPSSATLATTLTRRWHSGDRLALGAPVFSDVVVTWSAHTVSGRDARTGAVRWTYTRSDRQVCAVLGGVQNAAAIYAHDGNCDEVTGLSMGTGERIWNRTFMEDGTDLTMSVRSNYALIRTPTSLHLFDITGGLDYWYVPNVADKPCDIGTAVLGQAGVLMTQSCNGTRTLALQSYGNKDGRPVATWSVPQEGRTPLSADSTVAALSSDGRSILVFGPKGAVSRTIPLSQPAAPSSAPLALGVQDDRFEIVTVRNGLLGLAATSNELLWQRSGSSIPSLYAEGIAVASAGRVLTLSAESAQTTGSAVAPGLSADARVIALANGVVAGTADGTSVYLG